jgi:hypothetical protein
MLHCAFLRRRRALCVVVELMPLPGRPRVVLVPCVPAVLVRAALARRETGATLRQAEGEAARKTHPAEEPKARSGRLHRPRREMISRGPH